MSLMDSFYRASAKLADRPDLWWRIDRNLNPGLRKLVFDYVRQRPDAEPFYRYKDENDEERTFRIAPGQTYISLDDCENFTDYCSRLSARDFFTWVAVDRGGMLIDLIRMVERAK